MCPGTLRNLVGKRLADFLGSFFFRRLDHKWTETRGKGGNEEYCAECWSYRHWTERDAGSPEAVIWKAGKLPSAESNPAAAALAASVARRSRRGARFEVEDLQ